MLAKVIAHGADRDEALARLGRRAEGRAHRRTEHESRLPRGHRRASGFRAGGVDTGFVERAMAQLIGPTPDPALAARRIADMGRARGAAHAAGADGPWARTDGFELGGLERRSSVDVAVEARDVAGRARMVAAGARTVVAIDGKPAGGGEPNEIVWAGSEAFVLAWLRPDAGQLSRPAGARSAAAEAGGEVAVPMHGRIVAVPVAVGEQVAKGGLLFTLEAMKMEHSVARRRRGHRARRRRRAGPAGGAGRAGRLHRAGTAAES